MQNEIHVPIIAGYLPEAIVLTQKAHIEKGIEIFQQGNRLVRIAQAPSTAGHTIEIVQIDKHYLKACGGSAIRFKRPSGPGSFSFVNCPTAIAEGILSNYGAWPYPPLRGLSKVPYLTTDGDIVSNHGYNPKTRIYLDNQGLDDTYDFSRKISCQQAIETILEPVKDFPFESEVDKSIFLAGVINTVCFPGVSNSPGFGISANAPGVGKSKIADILSTISTGKAVSAIAWGPKNDEAEKRLGALLLSGDPCHLIDNIEGPLGGELLCSMHTQSEVCVRQLGHSRIIKIPRASIILFTGNNLVLEGDFNRRALILNLKTDCERPETLLFDREPVAYARANRTKIVHAALSLARSYIVAGSPKVDVKPFGSFEAWSQRVRAPIVWSGLPDPCQALERSRTKNPEIELLGEFQQAWWETFGTDQITVRELIASPRKSEVLTSIANSISGNRDPARCIGRYLSRYEGRIVRNLRFVRCGSFGNAVKWKIEGLNKELF